MYVLIGDSPVRLLGARQLLPKAPTFVFQQSPLVLPSPTRGLGVDITNDFSLLYAPNPSLVRELGELRKHQSSPILILTAPNAEGALLQHHIHQLLRIPPQTATRITGSTFPSLELDKLGTEAKPVCASSVAGAETRRALERLSGWMISELLAKAHKSLAGLPEALDHNSALWLCELRRRILTSASPKYRIFLGAGTNKFPLINRQTGQEIHFTTLDQAREALTASGLRLEAGTPKRVLIPPSQPPTLASLVSELGHKEDVLSILNQVELLYSVGLISYPDASASLASSQLFSETRQLFDRQQCGSYFNSRVMGSRMLSGLLLPNTPLKSPLQVKKKYPQAEALFHQVYHYIFCRFIDCIRLPLQLNVIPQFYTAKGNDCFQMLSVGQELPPLLLEALFSSGSAPPALTFERPEKPQAMLSVVQPELEFSNLIQPLAHTAGLVPALRSLSYLLRQNFVQFQHNQLLLQEGALPTAELLYQAYGEQLTFPAARTHELSYKAVVEGREERTFFLNWWYHNFRMQHEAALKRLN